MEYIIKGRKPESFFRFFEEISAVPRESYHEEKIADYLVNFAKERGLEYYRDEARNVLIKKPATKGQEHRPAILFQAHTDMVCEKEFGVEHDFSKDPLDLYIDGNLLRARGTTLGADDGVGVATMLALLDGMVAEHPAYECLFTATEEPGLVGALAFDYSRINARSMINLDGGQTTLILACCAGGMVTDMMLPMQTEPFAGEALRVHIEGLAGGHAGLDIHRGRANANKLMGRMLAALLPTCDARVVSINGGLKEGAIARDGDLYLAVPDAKAATELLTTVAKAIEGELVPEDQDFSFSVETVEPFACMTDRETTTRICGILVGTANGAFAKNHEMTYLVDYSRNLGVTYTKDGVVTFMFYCHALKESQLDANTSELSAFAAMVGATVKHYNRYPGWSFAKKSAIRDAYLQASRDVVGKEGLVVGLHAGLECGIICAAVPGMEAISVGPNKAYIHSPGEQLDLDSCETFCRIIERLVEIF